MPKVINKEEMYCTRTHLMQMAGFTSTDLTDFLRRNEVEASDEGYPIFAIMNSLNKERKKGRWGENELDSQLKFERIQKERIVNQQRLGQLMPRELVKERVRITFQAVANKIRYAIKSVSPRLVGVPNARDVENFLTQSYNNALEDLERESKNVSWEQDGSEVQLTRTEMASDTGTDISTGSSEEDSIAVEE